ncbi:hypothetical protein DdX_08251 [Ditylenchus destructor]|uniref:Uncharacterized protein n=1 Tax=Ditylenchus destructor TaxID=166010 RepID=A0AAD4N2S5_9BILA|nr:hypothetical protein DdX_08251 [Ditylenchus destructor]
MDSKYHMNKEWRFVGIADDEQQLESIRRAQKVYSVSSTYNGEKLKYRCTTFRRTDCKYLMCSIKGENGQYELYETLEHNHELGSPSRARQSNDAKRAAAALIRKAHSIKNGQLMYNVNNRLNLIKPKLKKIETHAAPIPASTLSETMPNFNSPFALKRNRTPNNRQLVHMGPGWRFLYTLDTPEELERVRHEERVTVLSKTFGGEKIKYRCSTYSRTRCSYMICTVHRDDGKFEVYNYGKHIHPQLSGSGSNTGNYPPEGLYDQSVEDFLNFQLNQNSMESESVEEEEHTSINLPDAVKEELADEPIPVMPSLKPMSKKTPENQKLSGNQGNTQFIARAGASFSWAKSPPNASHLTPNLSRQTPNSAKGTPNFPVVSKSGRLCEVIDQSQKDEHQDGHHKQVHPGLLKIPASRRWKHFGTFHSLEEVDALRKSKGLIKQQTEALKTSNAIKTRYRCKTWQRTNCPYEMYSVIERGGSTFEMFEITPNEHNIFCKHLCDGAPIMEYKTAKTQRRISSLYPLPSQSFMNQLGEVFKQPRMNEEHYNLNALFAGNSEGSPSPSTSTNNSGRVLNGDDFLQEATQAFINENLNNADEKMDNHQEHPINGQDIQIGAEHMSSLVDGALELEDVAEKLSLKMSTDGKMFMFFSEDPSMVGRWLEFQEFKDQNPGSNAQQKSYIAVSEYNQCKLQREIRWEKADWNQFICAARGKCLEYFLFGSNDDQDTMDDQ